MSLYLVSGPAYVSEPCSTFVRSIVIISGKVTEVFAHLEPHGAPFTAKMGSDERTNRVFDGPD
jgi:hypothetical protein